MSSIGVNELDMPNRAESIKDFVQKNSQKYIKYVVNENGKNVTKIQKLSDFFNDEKIKRKLIDHSYTKLYTTKGQSKYIVDISRQDEHQLFGKYSLSSVNNTILDFTDKSKWSVNKSHKPRNGYKSLLIQQGNSIMSNLFQAYYSLKIFADTKLSQEEKEKKYAEIQPLSQLFNETPSKDLENTLRKYQVMRESKTWNVWDYLNNVQSRLIEGKRSAFLTNIYVIYCAGLHSLIDAKANVKDINVFKNHFKSLFKRMAEILSGLLPDIFTCQDPDAEKIGKLNFQTIDLYAIWSEIFEPNFDLNTDIEFLSAKILDNKLVSNSLSVINKAVVNTRRTFSIAEFSKGVLLEKDDDQSHMKYYQELYDVYSLKGNSPFKQTKLLIPTKNKEHSVKVSKAAFAFLTNLTKTVKAQAEEYKKSFERLKDEYIRFEGKYQDETSKDFFDIFKLNVDLERKGANNITPYDMLFNSVNYGLVKDKKGDFKFQIDVEKVKESASKIKTLKRINNTLEVTNFIFGAVASGI